MIFPFNITEQIIDAYQAHQDYISKGQKWLIRNDPEGQTEQVLLEEIITMIQSAAEDYFGDDEDECYQFYDEVGLEDISGGEWYDAISEILETTE